jgi:hypothetical protein
VLIFQLICLPVCSFMAQLSGGTSLAR